MTWVCTCCRPPASRKGHFKRGYQKRWVVSAGHWSLSGSHGERSAAQDLHHLHAKKWDFEGSGTPLHSGYTVMATPPDPCMMQSAHLHCFWSPQVATDVHKPHPHATHGHRTRTVHALLHKSIAPVTCLTRSWPPLRAAQALWSLCSCIHSQERSTRTLVRPN